MNNSNQIFSHETIDMLGLLWGGLTVRDFLQDKPLDDLSYADNFHSHTQQLQTILKSSSLSKEDKISAVNIWHELLENRREFRAYTKKVSACFNELLNRQIQCDLCSEAGRSTINIRA